MSENGASLTIGKGRCQLELKEVTRSREWELPPIGKGFGKDIALPSGNGPRLPWEGIGWRRLKDHETAGYHQGTPYCGVHPSQRRRRGISPTRLLVPFEEERSATFAQRDADAKRTNAGSRSFRRLRDSG